MANEKKKLIPTRLSSMWKHGSIGFIKEVTECENLRRFVKRETRGKTSVVNFGSQQKKISEKRAGVFTLYDLAKNSYTDLKLSPIVNYAPRFLLTCNE